MIAPALRRHVLAVSAGGLLLFAFLAVTQGPAFVRDLGPELLLLAAATLVAESAPLRIPRRNFDEEVTVSTTFSFAILLTSGVGGAVLVQGLASIIADVRARKPALKIAFNVGQYTLSLSAAGALLDLAGNLPRQGSGAPFLEADLPIIFAAAVVFFVVNVGLVSIAAALSQGVRVLGYWKRDLPFQASVSVGMLGLAPIVAVIDDFSLWLLPILTLPLVAVHRAGRMAVLTEHQALHDVLTDLPNRALFRDRTDQALATARREGVGVVVMLMDLDRFKEINDTLGHHHGDELLKQIGPRLRAALRDSDTVARLGGDEFAVLLPRVATPDAGVEVARKLLAALERPFVVSGLTLEVGASIGIASFPQHGVDVDTLIQRADVAMYVAKEAHSGCELYSPHHDEHSPDRLALVADLRRAIDERELFVVYQPKIELATGRLQGAEALVRWMHPQRGLVPPGDFIGHAEHTGLIRPLTLYVLDAALAQARAWRDDGVSLTVAVNLSVRALLDANLPAEVAGLLAKWGVDAGSLQLEITESSIMADPVRARHILEELHAMGISLSIDDFGTGYSSLGYLKRLPVGEIKIDRSFVMSMATDRSDATIVQSTIDLGRNLGLRVVAEGIETEDVRHRLEELGCHFGQGYLFSPPLPGGDLLLWADARPAVGAA